MVERYSLRLNFRFADPTNNEHAWSERAERDWLPVDMYIGGAEHAVLHLLYISAI